MPKIPTFQAKGSIEQLQGTTTNIQMGLNNTLANALSPITDMVVNNKIKQRVHPSLIPSTLDISNIDGVTNAVVVDGVPIGRTIYEGAGAGKGPT